MEGQLCCCVVQGQWKDEHKKAGDIQEAGEVMGHGMLGTTGKSVCVGGEVLRRLVNWQKERTLGRFRRGELCCSWIWATEGKKSCR